MKNLASFAVSSLFVSLVGCGDNNIDPQILKFPSSCLEAGGGDVPRDGARTLYFQNDEQKPWQAYCHKGDEYLVADDPLASSMIANAQGDELRTEYARLRIDPETLTIDITDATFATTTGGPLDLGGGVVVTNAPAGVAISCMGANGSSFSLLNVTETPFRVKTQYVVAGTAANGYVGVHRDQRWIETWVEGECGSIVPTGMTGLPVNLADGWQLELVYAGPEVVI